MLRALVIAFAMVLSTSGSAAAQTVTSTGHPTDDRHPGGWSASCYSSTDCDAKWQWHMKCVHQLGRTVNDCDGSAPRGSISAPVALFIGVPVTAGSLAALLKLAGESSNEPNATSDTGDPTAGYGKAFAIGSGVGLGGVLIGYGAVKLMQVSKPAGFTLIGIGVGAGGGLLNQSMQNDRKTPEQKDREKETGKASEDYKSAALEGAAVGAGVALVGSLAAGRFSDFINLPSAIRNNRLIRRTSVVSSPSLGSGTRIGVVFR